MIGIFVRPVPAPEGRRLEGVPAPLARASSKEPGRIAVERQRRDVAQVAWDETDVGQLAAIHVRKRPERRSGGGDAERSLRRGLFARHGFRESWVTAFL